MFNEHYVTDEQNVTRACLYEQNINQLVHARQCPITEGAKEDCINHWCCSTHQHI